MHSMISILVMLVFLALQCAHPARADGPDEWFTESLADELAAAGHRDIAISAADDTLHVHVWPIGFRSDFDGYSDVMERLRRRAKDTGELPGTVRLSVTSWGVPVVTATGDIDRPSRITFTRDIRPYIPADGVRLRYPARRLQVLLNVPVIVNFGWPGDPLVFKTGLEVDGRFRITRRIWAYAETYWYAHNEYDPSVFFEPGNIGVVLARPLAGRVMSVTNAGVFRPDIYGIDEELRVSWLDGRLSAGLHAGYYGHLKFDNELKRFRYRDPEYELGVAYLRYDWDRYDSSFRLFGGRFLYGDSGAGLSVSRVFRELAFIFTAIRTTDDIAANVAVAVPLWPSGRMSRARYGIGAAHHFTMRYWYYDNHSGREPGVDMSLDRIEGFSGPAHFHFMEHELPSR